VKPVVSTHPKHGQVQDYAGRDSDASGDERPQMWPKRHQSAYHRSGSRIIRFLTNKVSVYEGVRVPFE
jgi:hypothetical protein